MTHHTASPHGIESLAGLEFEAILFDLDGTLIDSTIATERAWTHWGTLMGLSNYTHTLHGLTAQSLVNTLIDEPRHAEALELITRLEIEDTEGIHLKDGVGALLASLPAERWTIVTSCTSALASARMGAASLARPLHMVTADQVATGKPSPEGFLLSAQRLGVDISRCLVVEDAPAGLSAGNAAGAYTLAVTGTYGADALEANAIVNSLAQIEFSTVPNGSLRLTIAADRR
ncbi:phosphatase [Arthrobacter sp. MYb227]|uniref:HAD-IA family hydrolase n=1 Tax=Arthrobacter sp. MYb227 TaxID=1848601 RepID=UPI000CFDFD2C|nr:HAD-IA family hydrolase [Arthrobacter sp. MYb227]PQZ89579.1 phosphatase [Arthrobacter sp. MYb227]